MGVEKGAPPFYLCKMKMRSAPTVENCDGSSIIVEEDFFTTSFDFELLRLESSSTISVEALLPLPEKDNL